MKRSGNLAQRRNAATTRRCGRTILSILFILFLLTASASVALFAPFEAGAQTMAELTIAAGGDVMFGRVSESGFAPIDDTDSFAEVRDQLMAADLAIVNLETALCDVAPLPGPRPTFAAPTAMATRLAEAGVDVAVLANNHSLDCGLDGLATTIDALSAAGITPIGATTSGNPLEPTVIEVNNRRIALIAATLIRPNQALLDEDEDDGWDRVVAYLTHESAISLLPLRVRTAREVHGADLVIVSLHWGVEGVTRPSSSQVELAHSLVDSGADLILGHHSHVVQEVESYNDSRIAYSLGNLTFDSGDPPGAVMTFLLP